MMQIIRRLLTCRIFAMHQKPGGAGWLGLGSMLMQEEVVWSEEWPPSHVAQEPVISQYQHHLSEYHLMCPAISRSQCLGLSRTRGQDT